MGCGSLGMLLIFLVPDDGNAFLLSRLFRGGGGAVGSWVGVVRGGLVGVWVGSWFLVSRFLGSVSLVFGSWFPGCPVGRGLATLFEYGVQVVGACRRRSRDHFC